MRCRKVRSFLSTYCKGELAPRKTAAVETHLRECASCRREEEMYKSVNKLVVEMPSKTTSDDFTARLLQRIENERAVPQKSKVYMPGRIPKFGAGRLATISAVAVVVLAFAVGMNFTEKLLGPTSPGLVTADRGSNGAGDDNLYLTVQPVDNPLLNQRKSVSSIVKQYNRWREYSRSLRSHDAAEQFFNSGGNSILAASNTSTVDMNGVRVRPVIRNYLIVPGQQNTAVRRDTY